MNEHMTAVALLFSVQPTDRCLSGWQPRLFIPLGRNAMYAKEWAGLAREAPCGITSEWFEETSQCP